LIPCPLADGVFQSKITVAIARVDFRTNILEAFDRSQENVIVFYLMETESLKVAPPLIVPTTLKPF